MRVCARSRAEKGHELTVVLGKEARTEKCWRSGIWRLCRVGSVQVGLGPDDGADRTCQWVREGKTTESKRTPPGPWPKLQGDSTIGSQEEQDRRYWDGSGSHGLSLRMWPGRNEWRLG